MAAVRGDFQKPMEECATPEKGKGNLNPIEINRLKVFELQRKVWPAVEEDADQTALDLSIRSKEVQKKSDPIATDKLKMKQYVAQAFEEDAGETVSSSDLSNIMEECTILKQWKDEWDLFEPKELKIFDKKIKVLETLEVAKRKGLKQLAIDIEKLLEMQLEIEELEELLIINNIEIDEKKFEMFCNSQLSEESFVEPMDFSNELIHPTYNQRDKISATSKPTTAKPKAHKFKANEDGMVTIGPNGTMIHEKDLEAINWSLSGAAITRKILVHVFGRETLAFHTLTGKPSPAFMDCDKPLKNQLDPLKVADIIHLVTQRTKLSAKEVRNAITTKCADENKMFRQREKKKLNATANLQ